MSFNDNTPWRKPRPSDVAFSESRLNTVRKTAFNLSPVPASPIKSERTRFFCTPKPSPFPFVSSSKTATPSDSLNNAASSTSNLEIKTPPLLFSSTSKGKVRSFISSPTRLRDEVLEMSSTQPTFDTQDSFENNADLLQINVPTRNDDVNFLLDNITIKYTSDFLSEHYSNLSLVGKGSFSEVYSAIDGDGLECAVKKTVHPFTGFADRQRKLQEAFNLQKVSGCPNCVQLQLAWEQRGLLYLQTDLCVFSLEELIQTRLLAKSEIMIIIQQAAFGLTQIHSKGLIHMDIKPSNIGFTIDGVLKILDFGMSCSGISDSFPDGSSKFLETDREGDHRYLAPEILSGLAFYSSDVFSLGLVFIELLFSKPLPNSGEEWHIYRKGFHEIMQASFLNCSLSFLLNLMLEPQPEKRPSAEYVGATLTKLIDAEIETTLKIGCSNSQN